MYVVRAVHERLDWDLPYAKWFVGGKLNATYNCVDRHVEAGKGDKVAFHWEGEPVGDRRRSRSPICSARRRSSRTL